MASNVIDIVVIAKDLATQVLKGIGATSTGIAGKIGGALANGLSIATTALAGFGLKAALAGGDLERLQVATITLGENMGVSEKSMRMMVNSLEQVNTYGSNAWNAVNSLTRSGLLPMIAGLEKLNTETGKTDKGFNAFILTVKDLAASVGMSSGEAIQTMSNALITLEPQMLKSLGIQVNLTAAYKDTADALGTTVDQLSQSEKTQALLNAVMLEGEKVAGTYSKTYDTAGKNVLSMRDALQSTIEIIGLELQPLFRSITNDLLAQIKAFRTWVQENRKQISDFISGIGTIIIGAMNTIKTVIGAVILGLDALRKALGLSEKDFGKVLGIVTTLTIAFKGLNLGLFKVPGLLGNIGKALFAINPVLGALGVAVAGFAVIWSNNMFGIQDATVRAANKISEAFANIKSALGIESGGVSKMGGAVDQVVTASIAKLRGDETLTPLERGNIMATIQNLGNNPIAKKFLEQNEKLLFEQVKTKGATEVLGSLLGETQLAMFDAAVAQGATLEEVKTAVAEAKDIATDQLSEEEFLNELMNISNESLGALNSTSDATKSAIDDLNDLMNQSLSESLKQTFSLDEILNEQREARLQEARVTVEDLQKELQQALVVQDITGQRGTVETGRLRNLIAEITSGNLDAVQRSIQEILLIQSEGRTVFDKDILSSLKSFSDQFFGTTFGVTQSLADEVKSFAQSVSELASANEDIVTASDVQESLTSFNLNAVDAAKIAEIATAATDFNAERVATIIAEALRDSGKQVNIEELNIQDDAQMAQFLQLINTKV